MTTRRQVLGLTVAAAVAAALRPAWAGFLGFGRGRGLPARAGAFDYYVSPTGSASNTGSLESPWDISVFAMTPNANTASYYQGLMTGKRIGLLPGTYPVYPYWNQQHNTGYAGVCLTIPSGTGTQRTYVASCDANGNYSARTATLDAHPGATVGQSSVTPGLSARVTAVATGTTTTLTFESPPNKPAFTSNPFSVNDQVWLADEQSGDWSTIGIQTDAPNTPGTYYIVTAASAGSGPTFTITINASTTDTSVVTLGITTQPTGTLTDGTYSSVALTDDSSSGSGCTATITVSGGVITSAVVVAQGSGYAVNDTLYVPSASIPGATANGVLTVTATGWRAPRYPTIYRNYPSLQGQLIGNAEGGGATGLYTSTGNWTLDGVIVTGAMQNGIGYFVSKYLQYGNGEPNGGGGGGSSMQIASVSTGSQTTFTIAYSGTSNPYSAGNIVYFKGIQATGTGETLTALNLNDATQNRYTISSAGGATGAWTFTIDVATSGTFVTGTTAYVGNQGNPVTIQNCEVYDCEGEEDNNPGAIHIECAQGCLIENCLIHDNMLSMGELNEAGGAFVGFCNWDLTVQYCTIYNVQSGIYDKSLATGNITIQYNYIQVVSLSNLSSGVQQGQGQVIPGLALTVRNNIILANSLCADTTSDGQNIYAGSLNWYNNTWYWPYNTGRDLFGAVCMSNATTSGPASVTPPAQGTFYNNLYNAQSGGSQINTYAYMAGLAAGTSSAPTNVNIILSDYNGYDGSATVSQFVLGTYQNKVNFGLGNYDLSAWQTATGLDLNSTFGTPTYASANLGYQYPTSNFQLASGSFGKGAGRIGGTSVGAATDMGAWGGIDVNTGLAPAQIGCNF